MTEKRNTVFLFDWDGVIAKRTDFIPIWDHLRDQKGIDPERTKSALKKVDKAYQTGAITNAEFWDSICLDIGLTCDVDYLNRLFFSPRKVNEQLLETIGKLRNKAYVGVVSNNFDVMRDRVGKEYGQYFDGLFFSCDTRYTKPSIEPFRIVSERFGVKLGDLVFVDDDPRNLDPIRIEGIRTIHFKWEEPDQTELLIKQLYGYLE